MNELAVTLLWPHDSWNRLQQTFMTLSAAGSRYRTVVFKHHWTVTSQKRSQFHFIALNIFFVEGLDFKRNVTLLCFIPPRISALCASNQTQRP